jgi:hypothetical protein
MMTEPEIREELAPRVARLILSRQGQTGISEREADQLAHQILALAAAAFLRGQIGLAAPPAGEISP